MAITFYKTKLEADNDVNDFGTVTTDSVTNTIIPNGTKYSTYSPSLVLPDGDVSGSVAWVGSTSIRYTVNFASRGYHEFYIKAWLTIDNNSRDYYAKFRYYADIDVTRYHTVTITVNNEEYGKLRLGLTSFTYVFSKTYTVEEGKSFEIYSDNSLRMLNLDVITPFPSTYCSFLNWSDNAEDPIMSDTTIIATFSAQAPQNVNSSVSPSGAGYVSPTSLSDIPYGSPITVNGNVITVDGRTMTAYANSDYEFDSWSNVPETLTDPRTFVANFNRVTPYEYSLQIYCNNSNMGGLSKNGGSTVPEVRYSSLTEGTAVTVNTSTNKVTVGNDVIEAKPGSGYKVSQWSKVGTFYMDGNKTLMVTFVEDSSVTVTTQIVPSPNATTKVSVDGGTAQTISTTTSVTWSSSLVFSTTVNKGRFLNYEYTLSDGSTHTYSETNWTPDYKNITKVVVNIGLAISASVSGNGTISPSGTVSVNVGDRKTFTAIPNEGYVLSHWIIDNTRVEKGDDNTYTFIDIQESHTIQAVITRADVAMTITLYKGINYAQNDPNNIIEGYNLKNASIDTETVPGMTFKNTS